MKKLLQSFLVVALGITPFISSAQYNIEITGEKIDAPNEKNFLQRRSQKINYIRGTETITDTNRWAWARTVSQGSATYFLLPLKSDQIKGFATYFDIPDNMSIDVSGLDFYARSMRADNQPADVSVKIYQATADSMISNLIDSVVVPADTFTGTLISGFAQSALFSSTHTVNDGFFLALEVNSTDSVEILRGAQGSGAPDFPGAFLVPGAGGYVPSSMLGQSGAIVSHVYPYVEYEVSNSISTSADTIFSSNDQITFTSSKSIDNSRLWSLEGFINSSTSYWSFDGGTWGGPVMDTTSTFNDASINHTAMLNDTITSWSAGQYVITESVTIIGDEPTTGINSLNEGNIKVYRSQNMLNVEVNGNLNPGNQDLFIYNVAGQLVKSSRVNLTANSTSRVNINELNSGLYIVKVADETVRFVK